MGDEDARKDANSFCRGRFVAVKGAQGRNKAGVTKRLRQTRLSARRLQAREWKAVHNASGNSNLQFTSRISILCYR
jgi:hypothetical protein